MTHIAVTTPRPGAPDLAQPYGNNQWNMYASTISGVFDTI